MDNEKYEEIATIIFNSAYAAWSMSIKINNYKAFEDLNEPNVGDFVFELSNPFVPKLRAIGKLLEQSNEGLGTYKIECIDGNVHVWENAKFIKIADENTLKLIK